MKSVSQSIRRNVVVLMIGLLLGSAAIADDLLRADHPAHYVVKKGDTLWDISARFLRSPWRWPEIWYVNPQIRNPHLIYPGDRLDLVYVNGKPRLVLSRGPIKLSPHVRAHPWDGAIPTIPIGDIAPFLSRPYVLEPGQAEVAPYIVSFGNDHIVGGTGVRAYVRSLSEADGRKFHVVRPGGPYKDADTGEILGYEATYIGTVEATRAGDPATVFFNSSEREAVIGDRLIPITKDTSWTNFIPHHPGRDITGSIIAVMNGVSQIGQYNVVVLDRGAADGLEAGHVLRIDQRGEVIRDVVTPDSRDTVKLPDEEAGLLMVFRTFDRVSFGLVLNAIRPIHVGDRVRKP
ncbi:MAG: LysM peptidoglycan-binding domain-containing protein [Gammaproteobacteria bacterium]|nr:MAG: LysM peptidoglycan-binding domain-containing protein [Gammaproteobacteria bacterium]